MPGLADKSLMSSWSLTYYTCPFMRTPLLFPIVFRVGSEHKQWSKLGIERLGSQSCLCVQ